MASFKLQGKLMSQSGDVVVGPADVDGIVDADSADEAVALFSEQVGKVRGFLALNSITVEAA